MSKNVAMFVDVANMYYAARGQDVDVDYVALLKHATKGRDLIRAYAYTGLDPENENQRKFIDFLGKNGYKPVVKDIRKFGDGRMKANLDIELVVDLFRLADRMDIAVIVSGDGDFAPAIRALQDKGVRCEVISFKPNTSSDLVAVADEFMDIMKVASISRKEGRALRDSMSAPEMPAKEVNPEFGFREASPSVAAAALAAIRGGPAAASPVASGRRTTRTAAPRRAATTTEDDAAEAVPVPAALGDAAAEASEETRRRRRRRGGRGRGRTRRDDEGGLAVAAGEEIGWEELDDLSQVDGLDVADVPDAEREYSFEEADADTLAELGLSPEELAALVGSADGVPDESTETPVPEATPEEEKPKRRRSSRAKQPTDEGADGSSGVGSTEAEPAGDDEKPKRRRSTRAKQDDGAAAAAPEESAPASDGDKPRARRSTRSASKDDAGGSEKPVRRRSTRASGSSESDAARSAEDASGSGEPGAEPQGIWGRFRSARKPRSGSSSS